MNTRLLLTELAALIVLAGGIFMLFLHAKPAAEPHAQVSSAITAATSSAPEPMASSSKSSTAQPTEAKKDSIEATKSTSTPSREIERLEDPYSTPPIPFTQINVSARAALVNIICVPQGAGLNAISGTGTIIDSRGIILTNAHVAQYVLLSESRNIRIACTVRSGSPASAKWLAQVLYLPRAWMLAHASEIKTARPLGTGEHDYALLYITDTVDGSPLPATFPYLSPDTREAIGFVDDPVLAASYPVEFVGSNAENQLYAVGSITTIKQLMTFTTNTVDVLSLGGIIEAQSGSSGGAVVNAWNRIIGVITTTSEGATTAERDLRAITLSYIDRDLQIQTGSTLAAVLSADPEVETLHFTTTEAPLLIQMLVNAIKQ